MNPDVVDLNDYIVIYEPSYREFMKLDKETRNSINFELQNKFFYPQDRKATQQSRETVEKRLATKHPFIKENKIFVTALDITHSRKSEGIAQFLGKNHFIIQWAEYHKDNKIFIISMLPKEFK